MTTRSARTGASECLTIQLAHGKAVARLVIAKRAAAPGRLVGVAEHYPVFESRSCTGLSIGGRRLQFGGAGIREALCGHGRVLALMRNGSLWLCSPNGASALLPMRVVRMIGAGVNRAGFWVARRSGAAYLVSPTGRVRSIRLQLPAPARMSAAPAP